MEAQRPERWGRPALLRTGANPEGGQGNEVISGRGRGGCATTWSNVEVGMLARAVNRAPSVHNTQPWVIEIGPDSVELYERSEVALPRHDPSGRDRVISCGAAVVNLELAIRALGRNATVSLFPEATRPDLVAKVRIPGRKEPTRVEEEQYSANLPAPQLPRPIQPPASTCVDLALTRPRHGHAGDAGAPHRPPEGVSGLGRLAGVRRGGPQRRPRLPARAHGVDTSVPGGARAAVHCSLAGLVREDTRLADRITLTERLMGEGLLVILPPMTPAGTISSRVPRCSGSGSAR